MKTFETMAAQGDVLIRRIDAIPHDAVPAKAENGAYIIAHSETGHHHAVMERDDVEMLIHPTDGLIAYLNVIRDDVILEHRRPFDTHEPIKIARGKYEIRRQREYVLEGFRRVAD